MNKLSKIFLSIIIILVIALIIMTYLYFDMRNTAREFLNSYSEATSNLVSINEALEKAGCIVKFEDPAKLDTIYIELPSNN